MNLAYDSNWTEAQEVDIADVCDLTEDQGKALFVNKGRITLDEKQAASYQQWKRKQNEPAFFNPTESLRDKIAANLSGINPKLEEAVAEIFASKETKKRTDALVVAIEKLNQLEKDFKKMGPDNVQYDEDGKKTLETFTKKRLDERAKAKKTIQRFISSINKAIDKNEWQDIYNIASGKDPKPDREEDSGETDTYPAE